MPDVNVPIIPSNFTPVGNLIKPAQQTGLGAMSLGDIVNMAGGLQTYQKQKELLPYAIEAGKAESARTQTGAEAAALELNQLKQNIIRAQYGGLLKDPRLLSGDREGIADALRETHDEIKNLGVDHPGSEEALNKMIELGQKDPKRLYQAIKNNTERAGGVAAQYQSNQPIVERNAAGQTVITDRMTGQQFVAGKPGYNPNVTSAGAQGFADYNTDLNNRVASGIQIDARLGELEDLMGKFRQGAGTRTYQDLAARLQAVGAPQSLVDKVAGGDLSATQSFNKFIAQSITSGVAQASGDKTTAAIMNNYLTNNPDVNTDPRALQRFIDFTHKINNMAYEEQNYLLKKQKEGNFNPDTHVAETQQHIRQTFGKKPEEESKGKRIVKTGTLPDGRKVVQYEDGTIGYK